MLWVWVIDVKDVVGIIPKIFTGKSLFYTWLFMFIFGFIIPFVRENNKRSDIVSDIVQDSTYEIQKYGNKVFYFQHDSYLVTKYEKIVVECLAQEFINKGFFVYNIYKGEYNVGILVCKDKHNTDFGSYHIRPYKHGEYWINNGANACSFTDKHFFCYFPTKTFGTPKVFYIL